MYLGQVSKSTDNVSNGKASHISNGLTFKSRRHFENIIIKDNNKARFN